MKTLLGSLAFLVLCLSGIICVLIYTSPDTDAGRLSDEQSWIGLTKKVYVIGQWQPYLKTLNNCTNFRAASTPDLFKIWPEPAGDFCCEDGQSGTIASYAHSTYNGRYLHPIPYYDVGIITENAPFWTSWRPDRVSQKDITNVVWCEVNDLKKFYVRRYWHEALLKQGLLFSAIPFILMVEVIVIISGLTKRWFQGFPWFLGSEAVWDLVHLCLLGVNGSLLLENVGHSDPCGWEAVLLFNSAVVYTYLSLLSVVSAVLQQVALWSRARTNEPYRQVGEMDRRRRGEKNHVVEAMDHPAQGETNHVVKEMDRHPSQKIRAGSDHMMNSVAGPVEKYKVEVEWQLQRMSTQAAVFFVASLYCTFVTVYERDEFVAWLLGIIILALVWSCSVGLAMLCKAVKLVRVCYDQRRAAERQLELSMVQAPQQQPRIVAGRLAVELELVQRVNGRSLTKSPTF